MYWVGEDKINVIRTNIYLTREIIKHLEHLNLPLPDFFPNDSNEYLFTLLYDIHTFGYSSDKYTRDMWINKYQTVFNDEDFIQTHHLSSCQEEIPVAYSVSPRIS